MKADPEYVREHYGSLSDEELLAVDRADLVEMAQQCYDSELSKRGLVRPSAQKAKVPKTTSTELTMPSVELVEAEKEALGPGDKPGWLDGAAEVYSAYARPGSQPIELADARRVLEAAGIPCYQEMVEEPSEDEGSPPERRCRIVVPGKLNLWAASILERDLYNEGFENQWRAHLETLPDEDVVAMHPRLVFCNLYDRIDRANRVYEEELARRGLQAKPH